MTQQEKLTYTVKEMAKKLGIGVSKGYELTRQKGFPALRAGKRIIIPVQALNDYINRKFE